MEKERQVDVVLDVLSNSYSNELSEEQRISRKLEVIGILAENRGLSTSDVSSMFETLSKTVEGEQ